MRNINHILAVIDRTEDAQQVLTKAQCIAESNDAEIHIVRVIYEGIADLKTNDIQNSARLKSLILETEEAKLVDLCVDINKALLNVEYFAMWNSKTWQGILHAVELVEADLVVRSAETHDQSGGLIRTPDDWNLLRNSDIPILLVRAQPWGGKPLVLAALDVFDDDHETLNLEILRNSSAFAEHLGGTLHIVCTYPLFEPWSTEFGAIISYEDLKRNIETDIAHRVDVLCSKVSVTFHMLYTEEGHTSYALSRISNETGAEILFVGTKARQGVKGIVLGNTSERIIHSTTLDVVTVHEPPE